MRWRQKIQARLAAIAEREGSDTSASIADLAAIVGKLATKLDAALRPRVPEQVAGTVVWGPHADAAWTPGRWRDHGFVYAPLYGGSNNGGVGSSEPWTKEEQIERASAIHGTMPHSLIERLLAHADASSVVNGHDARWCMKAHELMREAAGFLSNHTAASHANREAEVAGLRAALEPFAKAADNWDGWSDGPLRPVCDRERGGEINISDYRRAREALSTPTAQANREWNEAIEAAAKVCDKERISRDAELQKLTGEYQDFQKTGHRSAGITAGFLAEEIRALSRPLTKTEEAGS